MPGIDSELVSRLRVVCGGANVVTDSHELSVYGPGDGEAEDISPLAVALPANMTEVASCVAACAAAGVTWSPRGAHTWLPTGSPGAAVTIALTRMRRVLLADAEARIVRAEAGTPGRLLSQALAGPGTLSPVEAVATLGGSLATPTTGPRTLAGLRLRVLAVTLVLPDGELAELCAGAPGYDLLGRFLGSAGAFGIAVDATVLVGAPA